MGEAAAAAEDNDDPRPPAAGAIHPDYPCFAALAGRMLDDQLCEAIGGSSAYSLFADVTADGAINAFDLGAVKQRLGRNLPTPAALALGDFKVDATAPLSGGGPSKKVLTEHGRSAFI